MQEIQAARLQKVMFGLLKEWQPEWQPSPLSFRLSSMVDSLMYCSPSAADLKMKLAGQKRLRR